MPIDAAATLLRAATHLDGAAEATRVGLEAEIPTIFFRGRAKAAMNASFSEAVRQGQRAIDELAGLGAPTADARAGILDAMGRIDPAAHPDLHRLRRFLDTSSAEGRFGILRDRLRLLAELDGLPEGAVREHVTAELDRILDVPARQITNEQLRRLAVIDGLPETMRPPLPPPVRDWYGLLGSAAVQKWDGSERLAAAEVHNLQLDRARRLIEADPGATLEAHDAELRAILAKPHDELTFDDIDRMTVFAKLPDRLRPTLLDVPNPWPSTNEPLTQLGSWRYGFRVSDGAVKARLDAMRMGIEHEAMLADPAVTRESVSKEVAEILATPTEQLELAQLKRLGTLLRLPEELRPALPAPMDSHYTIENLGLLDALPSRHMTAEKIYDAARTELLADVDPEVLVRAMRERVTAGGDIDLRIAAALARRDPQLLTRAGVSSQALRDQALAALAAGQPVTSGSVDEHLAFTRAGIERLRPSDPAQLAMRDELLETIDRNLARVRGTRNDTFGRHPDYAEVGRIAENAKLLHALAELTPAPAASAADAAATATATAAASRPAEVLAW